jgi:pyruvate decarboxylase
MLPGTQGVALAQKELQAVGKKAGQAILFEGDGSLQATSYELSTIIRYWLDVMIFILDNDSYTVERLIHGLDAEILLGSIWRHRGMVCIRLRRVG